MEVKVRFRFNKATGEVEVFQIEDQGSGLQAEEHNREHDRIAAEVGGIVERNPHVTQVLPDEVQPDDKKQPDLPDDATEEQPETPARERPTQH
jgi:hypothetical protein